MHFKITPQENNKIRKLLETKELNMAIANMLFAAFDSKEAIVPSKNEDEFTENLINFWELNTDNQQEMDIVDTFISPRLKKIDSGLILNNPYVKTVSFKEVKDGSYKLSYFKQAAFQPFPYDDIEVDDEYREIQSVGYSTTDVSYPIIAQNNCIWMSLNTNEIITMDPAIKEASGNVLVLGLGLGYFPFMVSLKEDVKSITIIEKDPTIIRLFKKHLLPSFPHKEKIRILEDDAFKYLSNDKLNYDYLFIDLWHSPEDGLPMYLKCKNILRNKYHGKVFYWLEKSILAMLRRCFLTLIEEQLNLVKENNYLKARDDYDRIINDLYFKTKNLTITSYEQIKEMLKDESLKHY